MNHYSSEDVEEILTKVTLLSFEIVISLNYEPQISAMDVLETLQEVFFWDRVPFHSVLKISSNVFPFKTSLSCVNKKKSGRLRSGEYGGCSISTTPFFFQELFDGISCGRMSIVVNKKNPTNLVVRTGVVPCYETGQNSYVPCSVHNRSLRYNSF
ncbi:hypothetical protein TNCV_2733141 [Trichonephila clavipes]|nr:hypothetical protein TNCV_2733141 [Trichonephila clavipes]